MIDIFFTTVTLNTALESIGIFSFVRVTVMRFDCPVGKYLCQEALNISSVKMKIKDMNKPLMALILVSVIQANIMVRAFPLF